MNKIQEQFLSIEQVAGQIKSNSRVQTSGKTQSFGDILNRKSEQVSQGSELKFSKHASGRLAVRNIELNDIQKSRLADGMQKAGEKGIKDSLVIMDQLAFIVNVPSNTVITAMDQTESKDNIFTNIDGAVIV